MKVGADRLARAAWGGLNMLGELADRIGGLPLAWDPHQLPPRSVIEVYPAATLRARGIEPRHRRNDDLKESRGHRRRRIVAALSREFGCIDHADFRVPHEFDAILCLLAARDFLTGLCDAPEDPELARREGWIWVRAPGHRDAGARSGG